jgi:outer membrane protein TolC
MALLFVGGGVFAQQRLEIDSILSVIERDHPVAKMYSAEIRSADEAAEGAKSWAAPELGTGFWMTPYDPSFWKKRADGSPGMGQYIVSVQQMIPNRKEQAANEKYMRGISAVSRERERTSLNELYAAAKRAYYAWGIAERKLRVLDDDDKLLDFMVKSAELRYKNNLGKLNAYYKVKAAIGELEGQRITVGNEIDQQRIVLNTLMNRDRQTIFTIDTAFSVKEYAAVDTAYLMQARSDIRAVDRDIDLTYLQRDLEKSKLKPQFGVQYDHMFGFGSLPIQFSLMATVRLPMAAWSSKSYKANIESLGWKAEALRQQREVIAIEASGQAESLRTAIRSKRKQQDLYEETIIPALRKNLETTQLAYEENTGELFELFDAWQSLNKTRMDYLDQLGDLLTMQVELEKILEQK